MDIKSKSFSHLKWVKLLAFLLVVISFTTMVLISLQPVKLISNNYEDIFNSPFQKSYFESESYSWEIRDAIRNISKLMYYKSEENIRAGNTIDSGRLEDKEREVFEQFSESENFNGSLTYEENYKVFKEKYTEEYKEELEKAKQDLIAEELEEFNRLSVELNKNSNLIYYAKQGDLVFSNTDKASLDKYKEYPALILNKDGYTFYPEQFKKSKFFERSYEDVGGNLSKFDQMNISFNKSYINEKVNLWNTSKEIMNDTMYKLLILSSVLIVSLTYLIVVTGKNSFKDSKVEMTKIDKIFTDISLISMVVTIPIWIVIGEGFARFGLSISSYVGIGIASAVSSALVLALVLSLVRHIKNGTLFSHALVFIVVKKIYRLIKDIYNSGSVAVKVAIAVAVYPLVVGMTFFIFPLTIALAVYLVHRKVKDYKEIKEGVKKIKEGNIDHKIEIEKDGEFKSLSEDINSIGEGLNNAVANELKSERLKTELISNVSHDIRTPLTSIISYVDLLKKETDKGKREEYLNIIENKSLRLKSLTDDLFEASKASSGNIPVELEKIDLVSLLTQGLGELDSKIKERKLDFKINKANDKILVLADGRLLWRSIENLLTNIFKYALQGSRVYIDIEEVENKVFLSIKNISAFELNITPDELMERFTRGDQSRTSEGSGLGLSISKSLVEAQGGRFNVLIDGDLFKVVIDLEKYNDN